MKSNKLMILVLMLAAIVVSSCQEKIKTTKGVVKNISDTTTVVKIDKYDIVFDTKQARLDNGAIMLEDSVAIHYIGDLRDGKVKALLIRLMPKKGTVVEAVYDPSKELKVKEEPMSDEQIEAIEKYARSGNH